MRGIAMISRSPSSTFHVAMIAVSSIEPSAALACFTMFSSAGNNSLTCVAAGCTNAGRCIEGCATICATLPGTVAICSASCPSDIDFSCGFHPRCACGTRSRTRRVVCASCSSSCSIPSMMAICCSSQRFSFCHFSWRSASLWIRDRMCFHPVPTPLR